MSNENYSIQEAENLVIVAQDIAGFLAGPAADSIGELRYELTDNLHLKLKELQEYLVELKQLTDIPRC